MKKPTETVRYIEKRDSKGRLIGYTELRYKRTAREMQLVEREIEANLKEIENEQAVLKLQFEEEERNRAFEKEQRAQEQAFKRKYSIKNFLIAFQNISIQIMQGLIEDDGSFFLLVDKVLNQEITVKEAVESHRELEHVFEIMTSEEEE